jgi:hypothetical protein
MRKQIIRSNVNPLRLPILFFAGRSVLTFRNPATGGHLTVKASQAKDKEDRKKKLPIFFVNVRILGDGDTGYVFGGTIFSDTMTMKLSKHATPGSQVEKVMHWLMAMIQKPQTLRDRNIAVLHEGRCCRCALPLTHPESINTGFGPDCLKYVMETTNLQASDFFEKIETPKS